VRVTSDARALPRKEEDTTVATTEPSAGTSTADAAPDEAVEETAADRAPGDVVEGDATADRPGRRRRNRRRGQDDGDGGERTRSRLSLPLVPTLAAVLVLLLAAVGYLWFTRAEASAVRTGHYVEALQAARSGIVDFTSFDHLTLDDDIEQVRRVSTGDLRDESVTQLEERRQQITEAEAVVNTEVIGAGVTRADEDDATVLLVIQSTQQSAASPQAQVVKYRIQVELQKVDGRWLLSGITGTER
jgi:hypothetical protein